MLKINNIFKTYGKGVTEKQVLKGISIDIKDGEIYGLIGANGAGKTTLMNIISQMITPTSGTIEINGKVIKSLNELRGQVGYMIDIPAMHEFLTPMEYFEFLAAPQKMEKEELVKRSHELLESVGLKKVENKQIKTFSRGMKQRMGIAAGLITNPKIILMDEPSSALDPQGRFEVIEIIRHLSESGKTIILSTHILADVERVCTKVGLLVNGHIIIEGKLKEVLDSFNENAFRIECSEEDTEKIIKSVEKMPEYDGSEKILNGLIINFKPGKKHEMFSNITKLKVDIDSISLKRPSIEEIFLNASNGKIATVVKKEIEEVKAMNETLSPEVKVASKKQTSTKKKEDK